MCRVLTPSACVQVPHPGTKTASCNARSRSCSRRSRHHGRRCRGSLLAAHSCCAFLSVRRRPPAPSATMSPTPAEWETLWSRLLLPLPTMAHARRPADILTLMARCAPRAVSPPDSRHRRGTLAVGWRAKRLWAVAPPPRQLAIPGERIGSRSGARQLEEERDGCQKRIAVRARPRSK